VCGLLSGALVCLSGNLHTIVYAWLAPGDRAYWYPDATRYIGYNPPVASDGTIHEFPHYSYVVADLHAHVINLMFVLTVVALALTSVSRAKDDARLPALNTSTRIVGIAGLFDAAGRTLDASPCLVLAVFFIGLFPATNFWDFPIYITVTAVLYLLRNIRRGDSPTRAVAVTAAQSAFLGITAYAVVAPFHSAFESISTQIAPVSARSKLYQLVVLYGYQAMFFVMLLFSAVKERTRGIAGKSRLTSFVNSLNPGDSAALALFLCAVGLVAIPEFVYVVDIYTAHPRANTMFKLTFQAFTLFALGIGYAFPRLFLTRSGGANSSMRGIIAFAFRRKFRRTAAALALISLFCAFMYPFYAIRGSYGNLSPDNYKGLDGSQFMITHEERINPDIPDSPYIKTLDEDYYIIEYLNSHVDGAPVIVEANGKSYTSYGRISAFTGLPCIFNWYTHEQLWRLRDAGDFNERISDINTIYTGADAGAVKTLLSKYNIRYIVIGKLERDKYQGLLNEDLLDSIGKRVFTVGGAALIEVSV
jgi:uncharacterized membrane protein